MVDPEAEDQSAAPPRPGLSDDGTAQIKRDLTVIYDGRHCSLELLLGFCLLYRDFASRPHCVLLCCAMARCE